MAIFSKENKEEWEERWFRVNGFPVYDTCVVICDIKNAAPIDFTSMTGYSEDEPLLVKDEEDNEGSEKNVGEYAEINEGKQPVNGNMEGISGQAGEDVVAELKEM
ncbi:hypothetical protein ACP275_14G133500 [Erythranthe tilingii]